MAHDRIAEREIGRERVAADAVLAEFVGHCSVHRHDGAFRCNIMQHHRPTLKHRNRCDIDDLAVAFATRDRQHCLDALEQSARIHRHHPVPFLRGDLGERFQRD